MPEYRLYCLNDQGHITRSHEIVAKDDTDAMAKAKASKLRVECELWQRGRLVGKVRAHP
jgi:hypothetical protein